MAASSLIQRSASPSRRAGAGQWRSGVSPSPRVTGRFTGSQREEGPEAPHAVPPPDLGPRGQAGWRAIGVADQPGLAAAIADGGKAIRRAGRGAAGTLEVPIHAGGVGGRGR